MNDKSDGKDKTIWEKIIKQNMVTVLEANQLTD